VAEVLGSSSISLELMDIWRVPGTAHAQVWEERFSQHALARAVVEVVARLGKDTGVTEPPTMTLVATPSRRFAASTRAEVGFAGEDDVQGEHRAAVGYCGAAEVGILLADALDVAHVGDTILVLTATGSVDAMLVRAAKDGPGAMTRETTLAARRDVSYASYLTWRGLLDREPTRRPERPGVSAPASYRNVEWKYGLEGSRCTTCGKVYLPPQRVCGSCGALDTTESYSLADRTATIVGFSTDAVSDSPAPPAVAAIVDFEGGGRLTVELADTTSDEIGLGDEVEMTFRRTYVAMGVPNYFWKARPVKGTQR